MKIKCIEHIWKGAREVPELVLKYGSEVSYYKVCEKCGKVEVAWLLRYGRD